MTGELLDAKVVGANSTIELFQTKVGSERMRHVRTYVDEAIQTPNRVAWVSDHAFVFSNDHSGKVGFVCLPYAQSGNFQLQRSHVLMRSSVDILIHSSEAAILGIAQEITAISRHHRIHSTNLMESFGVRIL